MVSWRFANPEEKVLCDRVRALLTDMWVLVVGRRSLQPLSVWLMCCSRPANLLAFFQYFAAVKPALSYNISHHSASGLILAIIHFILFHNVSSVRNAAIKPLYAYCKTTSKYSVGPPTKTLPLAIFIYSYFSNTYLFLNWENILEKPVKRLI
jgi:hypothetical protein